MRRAFTRVLIIATAMVATLGLLGAPAGADGYWTPTPDEGGGSGGEVQFLLFGCPSGWTITTSTVAANATWDADKRIPRGHVFVDGQGGWKGPID